MAAPWRGEGGGCACSVWSSHQTANPARVMAAGRSGLQEGMLRAAQTLSPRPLPAFWDPSDTFGAVTERALLAGMIPTVHASVIVQVFFWVFVSIVLACSLNAEGRDDLFSFAGHLQSSAAPLLLRLSRPRNQGGVSALGERGRAADRWTWCC